MASIRSPLQPAWGWLLAGSFGLILGLLLGSLVGGDPRHSDGVARERDLAAVETAREPIAVETSTPELHEATALLATEIRHLREAIERSNAAQSPARAAVGTEDGSVELTAALERWTEQLDRRLALVTPTEAGSAPAVRLPPDLRPPPIGFQPRAVPDLELVDSAALSKQHFLWTCQEVLDTYGVPSEVGAEGGTLYWNYSSPEKETVIFTFLDGKVIHVH